MARNTTRVGRRRRVLNEEVLSASSTVSSASSIEPGDTPRYGAGANIENHPQVTSFVPRRFRTLGLIALVGLIAGVAAELTAHFAGPLSELVKVVSPAEIVEVFSNKLVAWTSATLLLLTAGYTRLIFSLRRHRVDDYRGRYRVWRTAGWAAILLSLNSVLGGHELVARCLGSLVNWQMLPAHAGWWLAPAALIGGWLLLKLIVDSRECRGALAFYLIAVTCLTVAGVHSAGWSPPWAAEWPGTLSRSLPLLGYTFMLVGSLLFARYVILDVQGLIEHRVVDATAGSSDTSSREEAHIKIAATQENESLAAEEASDWVDGTEPEIDYPENNYSETNDSETNDEPNRRLSKADRKRLRKQKSRNRAA